LQRYKGLGEMDAPQLRETTMGKTRRLMKVSIDDAILAEKNVNTLMGDNIVIRKE
jgi:topoisomerase-4 subunit B